MPALTLSPTQRRDHRAQAHHLDPVVMIGADGLSAAVRKEVEAALGAHGLIKVRVALDEREARERIFHELADGLGAAAVQHIGKLLVLWRPLPAKAVEERTPRGAGPRVVKLVSFSKSGNHRATVKKIKVLGNERVTAAGQIKRVKAQPASPKKKMG